MTPFTRKAPPLIRRAYTVADGRGHSWVASLPTRGLCSGAGTPIAIKFCRTSPRVVMILGSLQAPQGRTSSPSIPIATPKFCRPLSASALVGRPPGFLFDLPYAINAYGPPFSVPAAIPSVSGPTSMLKPDQDSLYTQHYVYAAKMFPGLPPSFLHHTCVCSIPIPMWYTYPTSITLPLVANMPAAYSHVFFRPDTDISVKCPSYPLCFNSYFPPE